MSEVTFARLDPSQTALAEQAAALHATEFEHPLGWEDEDKRVYAALEDDRVVGVANVMIDPDSGWSNLNNIAVAEDRRGRGIGSAMIDGVLGVAIDEGCTEAWIMPLTTRNEALYVRHGFRVLSPDMLSMRKDLKAKD